jgi:type I restriction enzyme S subunit
MFRRFFPDDVATENWAIQEIKSVPRGWRLEAIKNIVSAVQSGFACPKKYEVSDGIPHLRPNNIGFWGKLDLSALVRIPREMVDLDKYSLKKGDVLFNNTNSKELVGRAALVQEDLNCGFSNHITRLRVKENLVFPQWLTLVLNYLWSKKYFLKHCRKWIGQAGINTSMLKSIKIPVPPLEEQRRIVARIEELLSRVEEVKRLQQRTEEELEKLVPAILDKAFRGALI